MLNSMNSRGLSKSKEVDVFNFPGAISPDALTKIDDVLKKNPTSLIVHVSTNDLTIDINLLSSVKRVVKKTNKISPNIVLSFSKITFRKDKKNLENFLEEFRLEQILILDLKISVGKLINLISNDNIKEEYLGIKKRHLNRKGNNIFCREFVKFY